MRTLILAVALATSACTTTQLLQNTPVLGQVCTAAEGTLIDEKVIYAAELAYNLPAHAYLTALKNGKISDDVKALVKPKLVKMYDLLKAVRAAKGSVNCDFNAMLELQAEVTKLLPARN
jgi:flagellar basal body rod protein FlgF